MGTPLRTPVYRALTEAESRYAQIEKEMLAIVFLMKKFNDYTFGRETIVHTDHKPLESIVKKPLHRAPKRSQGMMIHLRLRNPIRAREENVFGGHTFQSVSSFVYPS